MSAELELKDLLTAAMLPERRAAVERSMAEIDRLTAAVRDAHGLIDNDLVIPWIIAHKLDDVLGIHKP